MMRALSFVVVLGCVGSLPFGCSPKSSSSGDPAPTAPDGPIAGATRCGPPGGDTTPTSGPRFCELPGTDAPEITVPAGFCVREFTTTPVMETRVMRFAPNGDLFVAAPSAGTPGGSRGGPGAIVVLADDNHDGKADSVLTYAGATGAITGCAKSEADPADLSCVHGIAFTQNYVYYTRSEEVRRFPYKSGDRKARVPAGELVARVEGASMNARWTHGLEVRQDGRVLVSRGRFEAVACSEKEMTMGAVFSLDVTAPLPVTPAVVSDGFRNPMYLRCRPGCGDCFANELSGDGWAGIGGHEKLVTLTEGSHWGFPCCVARDIPAPGGNATICASLDTERVSMPLHDTPFGLDFETGRFGAPYTYGAFVALHGDVAGWAGTAISWAPTDPVTHAPTGKFAVFASGWGSSGKILGRVTELTFAPDGRLFVGDDISGRIFWIAPRTLARP